jgi:hypothetical protein
MITENKTKEDGSKNSSPDGSRSKIKELKRLLEMANCPNCDGGGAFYHLGEMQQCQFCHERKEALART